MKYLLGLMFCMIILAPSLVFAQTPCVITVNDQTEEALPTFITEPINNCEDPFSLSSDLTMPYKLKIGSDLYDTGTTIVTADETLPLPLQFTGNPQYSGVNSYLFKHEENEYTFIPQEPFELPKPSETELLQYALVFFGSQTQAELYTEIYLANYRESYFRDANYNDIPDEVTGDTVRNSFYEFVEYLTEERTSYPEPIGPGTYTLVFDEYLLIVTQRSWREKLIDVLVPTAHAQFAPVRRFAITFTLQEEPLLDGASSVLFLPGIQASRLYKEGLFGGVDTVWPPNELFSNDIHDLRMTSSGESVEDIYTSDIIDTTTGVGDVYAGFEDFLTDLVFDGVIANWTPFAYDWRYDVVSIAENGTRYEEGIRSAIEEIEYLAEDSFSGKVTLIGHSNGGLLAKALMVQLEQEGKSDLVDKVVLIGTPQLGTPKAVGTLLHGQDQGDGLTRIIMDAHSAREVMHNLPGAYGLLLSEKYFNGLTEPLVTFTDSLSTSPYRLQYGSSITNYTDYVEFVKGDDSLERSIDGPVSVPAESNIAMLDGALAMHDDLLDTWVAPDDVEVIEIVGTGLPTMKSLQYREVVEDKCFIQGICEAVLEMKPYALLSHYGDGTVVQRSAEGYGGAKSRYFIDLAEIKRAYPTSNYKHHNLTEFLSVQEFVRGILSNNPFQSDSFVSDILTEFNSSYSVEVIDSPVRILATDNGGNQTGVVIVDGIKTIKEEIPGSQYFELGGSKYLIVPKGTDRVTKLYGEEYGGYSLTVATLNETDNQIIDSVLENASTTPTMTAEYSNQNAQYSTVITDLDGNGTIDLETTLDGEVIEEEIIVTYPVLIAAIEASSLTKVHKQTLLVLIRTAEYYGTKSPTKKLYKVLEDTALEAAREVIKIYVKKHYLSATTALALQEMIQVLKDKQ